MTTISVDLQKTDGRMKILNAVNNGPTTPGVRNSKRISDFEAYQALEIPYARTHDASFYYGYGGEFAVDVHRIFRYFDADVDDPASYIFEPTDVYLSTMLKAGTKPFYRLGASIEHDFKFGTYPPKDFLKWAKICEHIIRHYNEGWANGFHMNIEYWEIWNEPDCCNADGTNPCWQGTPEQFVDLYITAASYLKEKFPHLKIGGPATCSSFDQKILPKLFAAIRDKHVPFDFFSYHGYDNTTKMMADNMSNARALLDSYGFYDTETIYDEWNYVQSFMGEAWEYTLDAEQGLKGASFAAAATSIAQKKPVDMMMYYDARPCAMNGLFDKNDMHPLKTYYIYEILRDLCKMDESLDAPYSVNNIFFTGAVKEDRALMMLTHFNNDDATPAEDVTLRIKGAKGKVRVRCYLTDEDKNNQQVQEALFESSDFTVYLHLDLFATYRISVEAAE